MAKVKYRIREFKPTQNQTGGHSFFGEAVVDNNLTDKERMQLATATLLGGCATTAAAIVIAIVLCVLFCSCTTTRYVPVNETRTEHHWHTDSEVQPPVLLRGKLAEG